MDRIASKVDAEDLAAEVERVQFWHDGTGIEMSHRQAAGLPPWLPTAPALHAAVLGLCEALERDAVGVMLNRLGPGVEVPVHTDAEGAERWHLPIATNSEAAWWDAKGGAVHMEPGWWYGPVPYRVPHQVYNRGTTPRVHLIVDVEAS